MMPSTRPTRRMRLTAQRQSTKVGPHAFLLEGLLNKELLLVYLVLWDRIRVYNGEHIVAHPMCVFITAVPITKLFACVGGEQWSTCATRDYEPRTVWKVCPSHTSESGGEANV